MCCMCNTAQGAESKVAESGERTCGEALHSSRFTGRIRPLLARGTATTADILLGSFAIIQRYVRLRIRFPAVLVTATVTAVLSCILLSEYYRTSVMPMSLIVLICLENVIS